MQSYISRDQNSSVSLQRKQPSVLVFSCCGPLKLVLNPNLLPRVNVPAPTHPINPKINRKICIIYVKILKVDDIKELKILQYIGIEVRLHFANVSLISYAF
jgi:hypothetical protein